MNSSFIDIHDVSKIYRQHHLSVYALKSLSLRIQKGEFSAIVGPSGSGKSTLLNLIGGLDQPTEGEVFLEGKPLSSLSNAKLADFRRDHIGFVFQSYNLISVLSARENIEYIMLLQGVASEERKKRVDTVLKDLDLLSMAERRPYELSGGQQQRVAIARALAAKPKMILADEPTANLDSKTGEKLLKLLRTMNEKEGITCIFSTHDKTIIQYAQRTIGLKDGQVEFDH